nr:hypothetical protein [Tanacetum cinerariifolium]
VEEEEEDELYRDVNINQGRGLQTTLEAEDSHVTLTSVNPDGQQQSSSVSSQFVTSMLNSTLDVVLSSLIQNLPNFGSPFGFDNRLRTLEANFSEVMQTNQFAGAVSTIPGIIQQYMDQRMNEASDRLHDEAQRENDEFLKTVYENMQKIIKEQVKEQVKVQVSKILPRIEQTMNEQLEAEVLTRSSHSSKTSYAVAADLSEMELKKILIEKMEGNKSIQRSDEQKTVTLKQHRDDDAYKDEEPFTGPKWGSKRRREGKEPELASVPTETATRSAGRSTQGSQSAFAEEPVQTTSYELMKGSCKSLVELEYHLEEVFKATTDQLDWVNPKGQQYPHNLLKPLRLIPNNRGRRVIPFEHFINNDLEYLCGGALSRAAVVVVRISS